MRTAKTLALALALILAPLAAHAQLMIIGNDDKITIDKTGKVIRRPPGKDSISVVDISSPEAPKIVANLPLMNSIVGPPTNLAITPDQKLAIVANAVDWQKEGDEWKQVPDNKLYVIDLTTSPPTSPPSTWASSPQVSASTRRAIWRSSRIAPTTRSACSRFPVRT